MARIEQTGGETWVIYVCPECGRRDSAADTGSHLFCDGNYPHEPRHATVARTPITVVPQEQLKGVVAHVEEAVTIAIVMLAGIGEVWAELDYPERCARAENELRALLDHLGGQYPQTGGHE